MSTNAREWGYIGLGKMGGALAHRLLETGHRMTVYDVDTKALGSATSQTIEGGAL
jgi:3-hydroxyisobutyrate dehydrogenase-like beta-hydroxyacid dehydrogenase